MHDRQPGPKVDRFSLFDDPSLINGEDLKRRLGSADAADLFASIDKTASRAQRDGALPADASMSSHSAVAFCYDHAPRDYGDAGAGRTARLRSDAKRIRGATDTVRQNYRLALTRPSVRKATERLEKFAGELEKMAEETRGRRGGGGPRDEGRDRFLIDWPRFVRRAMGGRRAVRLTDRWGCGLFNLTYGASLSLEAYQRSRGRAIRRAAARLRRRRLEMPTKPT